MSTQKALSPQGPVKISSEDQREAYFKHSGSFVANGRLFQRNLPEATVRTPGNNVLNRSREITTRHRDKAKVSKFGLEKESQEEAVRQSFDACSKPTTVDTRAQKEYHLSQFSPEKRKYQQQRTITSVALSDLNKPLPPEKKKQQQIDSGKTSYAQTETDVIDYRELELETLNTHIQRVEAKEQRLQGFAYGLSFSILDSVILCTTKLLFMLSPLPTFHFMFLRSFFCLTSLFFLYKFVLKLNPLNVEADIIPYIVIRALTAAVGIYLQALAMLFTDVTKVVIVFYSPFIPSLMSYLLIGEKVSSYDVFFFFISFIGMVFIMDPFDNIKGVSDIFGVALAMLASTIFTVGLIAIRKVKHRLNMWKVPFYAQSTALMASPVIFSLVEMLKDFTKETPLVHITIQGKIARDKPEDLETSDYEIQTQTLILLFMIGVLVIFQTQAMNMTLVYEKAGRASCYFSIGTVWAAIFDQVWVGSEFSHEELFGLALIIGSIIALAQK